MKYGIVDENGNMVAQFCCIGDRDICFSALRMNGRTYEVQDTTIDEDTLDTWNTWVPFYFEGMFWSGLVNTTERWTELRRTYSANRVDLKGLLDAQENTFDKDADVPTFGFTQNCVGERRLLQYFEENHVTCYED